MARPEAALELDLRGLSCPQPILKAGRALRRMAPGEVLLAVTTDGNAVPDFQDFARQTGHALLAQEAGADGATRHWIRRHA